MLDMYYIYSVKHVYVWRSQIPVTLVDLYGMA